MLADPDRLQSELDAFFERYLAFEPEEATTLGVYTHDGAHRDPTEEGAAARAAFFAEALARFEPLLGGELASALRCDVASVVAMCRWEKHAHEVLRRDLGSVEWSIYPYTMASYARAQGRDVRARIDAIPAILAARERCLREAIAADARLSPRTTVASIATRELPGAASDFDALSPAAADALRAHARFLADVVAPRAPEDASLGEDEYSFRLSLCGIRERPAELVAEAREHLRAMQSAILRIASSLAGATFRTMTEAGPFLRAAQGETLPAGSDTRAPYRRVIERVVAFVEKERLFHLPRLDLGMDAYPEGMRSFGAGTNWPAPLLDPSARGQFVVHPDPSAHPVAWAACFAIHEGVPGHFLQSAAFREAFGRGRAASPSAHVRAPVRFFCVADNVAFPRAYMRAMTNIEGWAVHSEELLRARGFHEGRDELFAHLAHAIRALRVIGDVGLHTRALGAGDVVRTLMEEGGLVESAARGEAERYARLPLQSATYFIGQRQFERLSAAALAARPEATLADLHDWLFSEGPVPPAELRPADFAGAKLTP